MVALIPCTQQAVEVVEGNPNLILVGRAKRHVRYRKVVYEDPILRRFLQEFPVDISSYQYVLGNIATSFKSVSKYKPAHDYDPQIKERAVEMLRASYSIVRRSRYTSDIFEQMDKSSSPGYPYNLLYKNKRKALQDHRVWKYVLKSVKDNKLDSVYWNLFVKGEPKKTEKIQTHDERTVVGAPLHHLAEAIYLFGEMNANIYQAGKDFLIPSTVGFSKFYRGFHALYQRMTRNGRWTLGFDADYSEFDKRANFSDFEIVANLRFSLLESHLQTRENWERIRRYYHTVINSIIVMETGDLIQKTNGNPSGQFNTITDNSIINEFRWYYMWCSVTPESFHNLAAFRKHVELIVCGDDSLLSASPIGQYLFPVSQVLAIGEKMGWNFKLLSQTYKPIHTLTYCSSRFFWFNGFVVPVPDNPIKTLVSLCFGSKSKKDLIREQLTRALAIRMESFFLPSLRSLLEKYIYFVFHTYNFQLHQTPPEDMLSYDELLLLNRDFNSMLSLYLEETPYDTFIRSGTVLPFTNSHIVDL